MRRPALHRPRTRAARCAARSRLEPFLAYVEPLQVCFETKHRTLEQELGGGVELGFTLQTPELGQCREMLLALAMDELLRALPVERRARDLQEERVAQAHRAGVRMVEPVAQLG